MQWVGYAELSSAVSNAGGLGIVSQLISDEIIEDNSLMITPADCLDTAYAWQDHNPLTFADISNQDFRRSTE